MALFAPVAPGRVLQELQTLGSYHLLLAHATAANPSDYEWIKIRPIKFMIMDNSVVELGSATSFKAVQEAQKITNANVVVLPDVYLKGPETVDAVKSSVQDWYDCFRGRAQLMIVPQGRNWEEWIECAEDLADTPHVQWWGVPRNLVDGGLTSSRRDAVNFLTMLNPHLKIHLLGFSDNVFDDLQCARIPVVEGIDSAVPLRAASLGISISSTMDLPPRGDWWDTASYVPDMDSNLELIRKWIR